MTGNEAKNSTPEDKVVAEKKRLEKGMTGGLTETQAAALVAALRGTGRIRRTH